MLSSLNQRLLEAQDQVDRLNRLESRIAQLKDDHQALSQEVQRLQKLYHREQRDVARLEGLSLTGLFYAILGSKEEQLERERQEALAAELKLREEEQRLTEISQELAQLRREAAALAGCRERYSQLLAEKEAAMTRSGGEAAEKLYALSQRVRALKWEAEQIREAQQAARYADAALARVISELESAEGWGTWDMLGGGLLATAAKHSSLDDAQRAAHDAQRALDRLRRELQDVNAAHQVASVSLDGFTRFADYFFDNLITDWIVQNRIRNSLASVRANRDAVADILTHLSRRLAQVEAAAAEAERERQEFIASFQ